MQKVIDYKAMGEAYERSLQEQNETNDIKDLGDADKQKQDDGDTIAEEDLSPPTFEVYFREGKLKAFVTYTKRPHVLEEAIMLIYFTDSETGEPIDLGRQLPYVSLFMANENYINQGSLDTKSERLKDDQGKTIKGAYKVSNVYFLMGGPWEVQIAIDDSIFFWTEPERQYYIIEFDPAEGACISHPQ